MAKFVTIVEFICHFLTDFFIDFSIDYFFVNFLSIFCLIFRNRKSVIFISAISAISANANSKC